MREALESAAAPRWGRQTNVHQPRSSLAQLQLDSPQGSRLTLPIPRPQGNTWQMCVKVHEF